MKSAAALIISLAIAAPALAQQATPSDKPIDWSKPVVGIDGPPAGDRQPAPKERFFVQPDGAQLPVEVYTIDDLKAQKSPTAKEFIDSLTRPAEPCDPAKTGGAVTCAAPKDSAPAPAAPPRN